MLLIEIEPFITSTSRLVIARPRPVPLLASSLSTCSKFSNICSSLFAGIPEPLSLTEKAKVLSSVYLRILIETSPLRVNLTAFPTRLIRICLTLLSSSVRVCGISLFVLSLKWMFFRTAISTNWSMTLLKRGSTLTAFS